MKKNNSKKNITKKEWVFLLIFFLFSIASIIFGCLCIANTRYLIIQKNRTAFSILLSSFVLILFVLCVWFVLSGKETLTKTFFSGYILFLFCLILIYILQRTGFFEVIKSPERLQAYLENAGGWMPVVYVLLQFLQVVILPIPSVVSTVAGVALFGALNTTIYSLIGILLGSFLAFFIGRKVGNKAVSWMIGEDTLNKWQKKLKGKDNLVLTIMFVLPLFPDDILCFIAGLSSMSTQYFIVMIVIARVLGVSATCFSFDFIPFNTWWGLVLWGLFFIFIITCFIVVYKNLDKLQQKLAKRFKIFRKKRK